MEKYLVESNCGIIMDDSQAISFIVEELVQKCVECGKSISVTGGNNEETLIINGVRRNEDEKVQISSTVQHIIYRLCEYSKITITNGDKQSIIFTKAS